MKKISPFLIAGVAAMGFVATVAAQENDVSPVPPITTEPTVPPVSAGPVEPHMAESLRADVRKLVVIADEAPPNESVTGSYEKETAGLLGGMEEGSQIGTISKEVGGVPVRIPIPAGVGPHLGGRP